MNDFNSRCKGGLYHAYKIVRTYTDGSVEICTRCRNRKFFNNKTPNYVYLSYHIRSMIQKNDARFNREYKQ